MDIKFNYNDTISTVNSKKPDIVDLETKDPVLLKSNKSANTVLPIKPNENTIDTDDVITSSSKRYIIEVGDKDDTYKTDHTRNFYRGRSFRFAGVWTEGVHYICDDYVVDFVVKDNTLLACTKSHMSSSENEPIEWVIEEDQKIGIISDYWDLVVAGAPSKRGEDGSVYLPSYDEENDRLVWTLVDSKDLESPIYVDLGLNVKINSAINPLRDDINSLRVTTTHISSDLNGLYHRVEDAEGNIGQLTLDARAFNVRMSDAEGNIGNLTLTAREFSVEMSNLQGDVGRLWLTAQEFGVRMSNAEGDVSTLKQTADEIQTRVENAEGDISQIHQRADEISSQVENAQGDISQLKQTATEISTRIENNEGDISSISQRADAIESTVENAQGDISQLRQTATEISSTVATNKELADGAIAENRSLISQTAEEIRAEVARVETDVNGNIEDAKSEMKQTADEISATVARNKAESDGSFQSVSSQLSIQADQIQSNVDSIESVEDRVTTSESNITQLSNEISTKVSQTDFNTKTQQIESSISTIDQKADGIRASVTTLSGTVDDNARAFSDYATATDAELAEMQRQLDGAIESWFYEGVPTLNNVPASNWTTVEDKNVHLGDLYYDKLTGYAYRFMHDETSGYYWTRIEDSDIVLALENAAKAQDTADNKRRVFLTQPTPPYDAGDLWVQGHTANNDGVIFRCVNSRQSGTFISSDWELASDSVTAKIARSNFEVLSDAIVGTVYSYTYDSNGVLDSDTQSRISQTANEIRLSVSNNAIGTALNTNGAINSALLDTGIDITNGDITLTANHIKLQNQNAVSGLELVTSNQKVLIKASSLEINGIFSTTPGSTWMTNVTNLNNTAQGYADTAQSNAEATAQGYATNAKNDAIGYANSTEYLTTHVVPLISDATSGLAKDSDYNYLKSALLDGTTTVAGGLVLSSLIKLGYNAGTSTNPNWQIMSGINGVAVPTEPGKGIAAWYGGAMEDGEKSGASANAAKTLFRMDGSGYLAGGQISWGNTGSIVIHGATLQGTNDNIMTGELVDRILEIGSWFVKDSYVDGNGVTRYYLRLVCGDTTNLAGFASDGFVSAGGLSDTSGSSGVDLTAVWDNLVANTGVGLNQKINIAHMPYSAGTDISISPSGVISYTGPSGGVTSVAGSTGDVTTEQIATALTSAGYKLTDTVITDYWKTGDSRTSNTVLAAPNGSNGAAVFRALVAADIPTLAISKISGLQTALDNKANTSALSDYQPKYGFTISGTSGATYNLANFVTSSGVTSVATGTGLTGGTITSTGTVSINSTYQGYISHGESAYNSLGNYVLKAGDTMNGSLTFNQPSSSRRNGIIGTYDANRAAAIWSMGASYQIGADGMSMGNLYGACYVYYGSGYTYGAGKSGGHSFVWAQGGSPTVALGNNVWTSGGFIKNGGTSSQFLKADGSVDSTSYYYSGNLSLATIAGSTQIGSSTQPVYYNGSALAACNLSTTYAPYNSAGYLPLSGGTLTGSLTIYDQNALFVKNFKYYSTTGWARDVVRITVDGVSKFAIGAYGSYTLGASDNGIGYAYIGVNNYDGTNLRFGSDSTLTWGANTIWHSGNSNLSTVPWACSNLTVGPFNAIDYNSSEFQIAPGAARLIRTAIYGTSVYINTYDTSFHSVVFAANGNVGIGTGSPSQKLHVVGNILSTGAITAGAASDIRLKTNIRTLSSSSAKSLLMALRPVSFTWNSTATELYSEYKGNDIGLIAQEVETLLPQAVSSIFEKYKRLDYTKFIPSIITVVQDHENRIRELEEENKRLKELLKINGYVL